MNRSSHLRRHAIATAVAALVGVAPAAQAVTYTWTSGNFVNGLTAPSPLAAADVLNINAGGNKFFDPTIFTNGGTVNWNADTLYFQSGGGVINNNLWNATSDNSFVYNGGSAPSFTNNGTFRKSGGLGSTTINSVVGFVNNGTLDAQTGTIAFVGSSVFNAGSVFSGAGVVNMAAGTNTFNGSFTSSNLLLSGGTHSGSSALLNGSATWSGGTVMGTWTVGAGQTLLGTAGANKFVDNVTLSNLGTFAWNTTDALYLQSAGAVRNEGLFVANQSMSLVYNGGSAPAFENRASGTVRAAAGRTITVNGSTGFVNNGGTLDALAGASIRYGGGSTFNTGTTFSGAGSNVGAGNNQFSGSISSSNLALESGIHAGTAAVLTGNVTWSGGYLSGTWTLLDGQTMQGQSGTNKFIDNVTFTNQGTINWNTTDPLYFQSSGKLVNQGLFVAGETATLAYNGGSQPSFTNASGSTVRAAAGKTLTINSSVGFVSNGATLDALAGGAIVYAGGSVFNNGTQFTGAGNNVATSHNSYNGALGSSNLKLQGGIHSGGNAVLSGSTGWSGGTLTGNWRLAAGHALSVSSGANKFVEGAGSVLSNQGTITWGTTDPLYLQSGAAISNQGLFVATESMVMAYNGGSAPSFENTSSGIVRAAAGKTLSINSGTGFVNNAGMLDALAGATINYGGAVFNTGTRFTGAGSNVATTSNSYYGAISSANLVLQAGAHTAGNAELSGSTVFSGGTLAGTWKVATGQTLTGAGGANKFIDGPTSVVTNQGTFRWTTSDSLYLQSGAALLNQGTMNFSADSAVVYNGGTAPSFVNTGLVVKSAGPGNTVFGNGTGFSNQGVVDVQTGTIVLPGNFTNNGTLKGVGAFALAGTLNNAGTVAPGGSPGTLSLSGNYAQTAAGTFAVELQSLATHDLFNISGTAAVNGTLAISCFANCSFAVGDVITILDSVGDLQPGTFTTIMLSGFATGAFTTVYDTAADRVQLLVTEAVTAVPEPGSYALLLAGLSVLLGWGVRRRG